MLKKPQNVYLPIDRFQAKVFKNRDSQKRGEWVENFALALAGESKDDFAESLLSEAQYNLYKDIVRQWRFKAKQALFKELGNKEPTEAQVVERCIEDYGEEFIEAFELVGKKDKRKRNHSNNNAGAPNGNNGDESTTACVNKSKGSARPSTDGDTRKDSRNITGSSNGASLESATSVENPFNEALDSRRGCNTGRAPSVARPGTDKISGISAQKNDQRRTGGHLLPSSSLNSPPVRSGAVDVLSLAYSGEFGNVVLSQEQYAQLGIKFGNQQKLNRAIDSLSCKIENGEKNPQNHYAELVKWANYRDDMEEKEELKASSAPHYETVSEHNARIVRESDKWIDEHFPPKRKAANG